MAKKRKKKSTAAQSRSNAGGRQPSYWLIVTAIFFFFAAGIVVKILFAPVSGSNIVSANPQTTSINNAAIESQIKLVAANFRCACGGCGELFLVDCTCDMPRGAKEEKDFIRDKLRQGLTVDQVVDLVDNEYGHKIS
jgi:cytochrome c-type biogenesis protein CcmH/NrfF